MHQKKNLRRCESSRHFAELFVALPCEAKPLVNYFGLKRRMNELEFTIYENETICLAVTGIGKVAMAAAVAYCKARAAKSSHQVRLNVGIAGHQSYQPGETFLADKITDDDSGKHWYPPLMFDVDCPTDQLRTVAKPEFKYEEASLYDMEASGFYETATLFSTAELVQCVKIVSDNADTPAKALRPKEVAQLIEQNLAIVDATLEKLSALRDMLQYRQPLLLKEFLEAWRFSTNQEQQLQNLLRRWEVLAPDEPPNLTAMRPLQTAAEVVRRLRQEVEKLPISFIT